MSAMAGNSPPDSTKSPRLTSSSTTRSIKTLVDRFVTAAQHDRDPASPANCMTPLMIQRRALRRHHHHTRSCNALLRLRRAQPQLRIFQRPCQHDHAGAAAVRPVIDGSIIVGGEIARIPGAQDQTAPA
jgi:hypothetical protein